MTSSVNVPHTGHTNPLDQPKENTMRKLIATAALALGLIAGAGTAGADNQTPVPNAGADAVNPLAGCEDGAVSTIYHQDYPDADGDGDTTEWVFVCIYPNPDTAGTNQTPAPNQ